MRPLPTLNHIHHAMASKLKNVSWHKTAIGSPIFAADFEDLGIIELDFSVRLSTGLLLTHPNHSQLLIDIQEYLCLQGVRGLYSKGNISLRSQREHFINACKVVDGLLMHDKGEIARFGFKAVSTYMLNSVVQAYTTSGGGDEGLYKWRSRLSKYLRELSAEVDDREIFITKSVVPDIDELKDIDLRLLEINDHELVRARVALYKMGVETIDPIWSTNSLGAVCTAVRSDIYSDTLLGGTNFLSNLHFPNEMKFGKRRKLYREYPRVYVPENYEAEHIQKKGFNAFKGAILSSRRLSNAGLSIPADVLDEFEQIDHTELLQLTEAGGFKHAPPDLVLKALRASIEFFYEHGEHLLDSCARVLTSSDPAILKTGKAAACDFQKYLDPRSVALGITEWSLTVSSGAEHGKRYASALRKTRAGLLDMVLVLFGACQVTLGIVLAPRSTELLSIKYEDISDDEFFLAFYSMKTGHGEHRRQDEVPLPKVALDMLLLLDRFHKSVGTSSHLLSVPGVRGGFSNSDEALYEALDIFLDFIEIDLDSHGRRYYFRQHQFRKFFAAVFFHCCRFAGLDALRWMLRHVDMRQVWAYVRSSVPGHVLNHYFAVTASQLLRDGCNELMSLSDLLQIHFGVNDLSLVSEDELTQRIEYLQSTSEVELHPIFISQDEFVDVHVGVTVFSKVFA